MTRPAKLTIAVIVTGALSSCGRESTPTGPSGPTSFLTGTWRGTVTIQDHLPMWVNMKARFTIDGRRLGMERIDLESDGAKSVAIGTVDLANFPEMRYDVTSRVKFQRMREIFFARESWQLTGDGDFTGTFHLFKGGHELAGDFTSPLAGVNTYRFPALHGSLKWTRSAFEVPDAGSDLYGGKGRFGFSIVRHQPNPRSTALFKLSYDNVELGRLSDLFELPGQRFAGRASGAAGRFRGSAWAVCWRCSSS